MKKFEFSLAKLLHYKEMLLEKEKNTLGQLRAEQRMLEESIASNAKQALEADAKMKADAARGTTIMKLQAYEFQIENARKHEKQLETDLAEQIERVREQMAVVIGLTQEQSGLEKLRDKQRAEYDYGAQRAEEEIRGELVSSRYMRSKAEAEQ